MWLVTLEVPEKISNKQLTKSPYRFVVPYSREGKEFKVLTNSLDYSVFQNNAITRKSEFEHIEVKISERIQEFDILKSTWEHILKEMQEATLRKDLFQPE